jgi:hypothetical protein
MRSLPRGSFVYLIFSFIDCLSSSPITSTKDPDHLLAVSKPYSHDAATRFSKTVVALLGFTMLKVSAILGAGPQKPTAQVRTRRHASTGFRDFCSKRVAIIATKHTYKNMGCEVFQFVTNAWCDEMKSQKGESE